MATLATRMASTTTENGGNTRILIIKIIITVIKKRNTMVPNPIMTTIQIRLHHPTKC